MNVQMNKQDVEGGFEAIATLEDLGRYLRGLREKRHVTQESLSTKIGAATGRKIARSRISEIENAKRDWVTERELRVYMCGLKCMPRHIDQVVTVLTQCTGSPARESPAGPEATSPATLDAFAAGSGGADDESAPSEEESDGDPTSPPQPSRRRWRRPSIVLVAALAQVVVAFAGLGVGWSLRGESGDRSMSPGSPTALLVPHSAPHIAKDAADFIADATFPDGTPVRVSQWSTEAGESRNRGVGGGDATGRDATRQLVEAVPAAPCSVALAGRRRPGTTPQCRGRNIVGPGAPDVRGDGVASHLRRTDADSGALGDGLVTTLGGGAE